MSNLELIHNAKTNALNGKLLDRESIIALLKIDPESEGCQELGKAAREVASLVCKDRAYLWAAIGMDSKPCTMNCDFCSLGDEWDIVNEEYEYSMAEAIELVKDYVDQGVRWIVLRTTQFYSLDKLIELVGKIKETIPGDYELGLNVGDFNQEMAKKLEEIGLDFVYHSLRLGEGINTKFDPAERLATMEAIKNSQIKLFSWVEPIGVEHSNEELADAFLTAMEYGAVVTGCMERIPVEGTPLGKYPPISEKRLAQIVAVTRLAANFHAPDIAVHKPSQLAIKWGANVTVVEIGANPRDSSSSLTQEWKGFTPDLAKDCFYSNDYSVLSKGE